MIDLNEMMRTAQECANEADALRKCVTETSIEVGKVAEVIGSGYSGQERENMQIVSEQNDEGFTRRLTVGLFSTAKEFREWQIGVETAAFPWERGEVDDHFDAQRIGAKIVRDMSIHELLFAVRYIEGFLQEWYEDLKVKHATRKVVRIAAEKIAASLKS